jgi:hypothetical protein
MPKGELHAGGGTAEKLPLTVLQFALAMARPPVAVKAHTTIRTRPPVDIRFIIVMPPLGAAAA